MKRVLAVGILGLALVVGTAGADAQVVPVDIPFGTVYYCTYAEEQIILEGVASGTWDISRDDATFLTVTFERVHGVGALSGASYEIPGTVSCRITPAAGGTIWPLRATLPVTVCRNGKAGTCLTWDLTITPRGDARPEALVAISGHCHAYRQG